MDLQTLCRHTRNGGDRGKEDRGVEWLICIIGRPKKCIIKWTINSVRKVKRKEEKATKLSQSDEDIEWKVSRVLSVEEEDRMIGSNNFKLKVFFNNECFFVGLEHQRELYKDLGESLVASQWGSFQRSWTKNGPFLVNYWPDTRTINLTALHSPKWFDGPTISPWYHGKAH